MYADVGILNLLHNCHATDIIYIDLLSESSLQNLGNL